MTRVRRSSGTASRVAAISSSATSNSWAYRSAFPSQSTDPSRAASSAAMVRAAAAILIGSVHTWGSQRLVSPLSCVGSQPLSAPVPPSGIGSTRGATSRTLAPSASAESSASTSPSSRRRPLATTRSASLTSASCRADGWWSWGSAPIGRSTSTVAASPTTLATRSPSTLVVATMLNGPDAGCGVGDAASDEVHAVSNRAGTTASARTPEADRCGDEFARAVTGAWTLPGLVVNGTVVAST